MCQFPSCQTDNGKKKGYYGIEINENGLWKLIWTDIDLNSKENLSNWSLLFKMRFALKTGCITSLYEINPFEEAINKAPYNSDIFEQRKLICHIIAEYINSGNYYQQQKEVQLANGKYRFTLFNLYGTFYTWSEYYTQEDCIECFQLDAHYDNNISLNLFANLENIKPLSATFIAHILSQGI